MSVGTTPLPVGLRWAVYLRSLSLQASWNPQRMQNLGLLVSLLPWLRRQPRNLDRDRLFCRRYYEFFNTNPYLANYIIGGLMRLEAGREAAGTLPRGQTQTFRDSLGRALASLGDQLFWLGLRPAVTLGLCVFGFIGWGIPVLGLIALVAVAQLTWRWMSLSRGFMAGYDIVELLGHPRWHRAIAAAKQTGMVLTGIVIGCVLADRGGVSFGSAPRPVVLGVVMLLPVLARRRWAGEFIVLAALVVALVMRFALRMDGS